MDIPGGVELTRRSNGFEGVGAPEGLAFMSEEASAHADRRGAASAAMTEGCTDKAILAQGIISDEMESPGCGANSVIISWVN